MRIAKPLPLVTTPLGVACGLYEAHRLAGGLVFLGELIREQADRHERDTTRR